MPKSEAISWAVNRGGRRSAGAASEAAASNTKGARLIISNTAERFWIIRAQRGSHDFIVFATRLPDRGGGDHRDLLDPPAGAGLHRRRAVRSRAGREARRRSLEVGAGHAGPLRGPGQAR